jgi:four helix bundle protein
VNWMPLSRSPLPEWALMMPYERLDAWHACHELFLETYRVTRSFPKSELYGLTSQMRRAAFSAAANVAEGSAKRGPREFRRFLDITLGSLAELSYALIAIRDLELVSVDASQRLDALRQKAGKLTWGLYRSVAKRADEYTLPPSNIPTYRPITPPDAQS